MEIKARLILSFLLFIISSCIVGLISNVTSNKYYKEYTDIKSNNTTSNTTKNIDDESPEIILYGEDVTIKLNEEYIEPGYQAKDNVDGDITNKVEVTSNLDNTICGTYTIIYTISDSSNNKTSVTRKVIVLEDDKTVPVDSIVDKISNFENTITNDEEINDYIRELNNYLSQYKVSVGYVNINNGFTYLYKENASYFGASLIKTIDAMYVYENNITDKDILSKVNKLISKSDNSAHAYLKDYIGVSELKKYSKSIGVTLSNCNERFYCDTTVIDQLYYLKHLYSLINTLPNGDKLKSYYINDYHNHLSFDNTYTNIHKYGDTTPYFHDVGIFDGEYPYMVVVLTSEKSNKKITYDALIGTISKMVYELNNIVNKNNN